MSNVERVDVERVVQRALPVSTLPLSGNFQRVIVGPTERLGRPSLSRQLLLVLLLVFQLVCLVCLLILITYLLVPCIFLYILLQIVQPKNTLAQIAGV